MKPKALGKRELADLREFSPLPAMFYARDTRKVAVELLGKILIVRDRESGSLLGGRIVETEAYSADDPASHSFKGPTPRSAPMFEEPGKAYVYFTYGMYDMLNFVTEPEGTAGAVLIRGLEPLIGRELMGKRRIGVVEKNWTNGPARLCRALGVTLKDSRESLQGPRLFVGEVPDAGKPRRIVQSPRIGISKATDLEWRYFYEGHPHVSPVRQNAVARPLERLTGRR